MISENKPELARNENWTILILGAIFIAFVLMTICVLSVLWLGPQKEPQEIPAREMLMIDMPTAMPASHFSISLPIILSGSRPVVSESVVQSQIWKVIKIKGLGYKLDGQRYDLAVFKRVDSQDTVKAYCINRGWDTPDIGTKYLLNTEGIFVPLQEPDDHPLQRFLMIQ